MKGKITSGSDKFAASVATLLRISGTVGWMLYERLNALIVLLLSMKPHPSSLRHPIRHNQKE